MAKKASKAAKKSAKKTESSPRVRATPGAGSMKPLNPPNKGVVKSKPAETPAAVEISDEEREAKLSEAILNSEKLPWFQENPDRSNISVDESVDS